MLAARRAAAPHTRPSRGGATSAAHMLPGAAPGQPWWRHQRRAAAAPPGLAGGASRLARNLSAAAMFNFWPFNKGGSGDGGEKKEGRFDSILKAARAAKPGCPLAPSEAPPGLKFATFAGGCFWGLELAYQRVPGVVATSVGYTGGDDPAPTYDSVRALLGRRCFVCCCCSVVSHTADIFSSRAPPFACARPAAAAATPTAVPTRAARQVCMGFTGHAEAVRVTYDPKEVAYEALLDVFFERVDPTTLNRQGADRGTQYRR